ICLYSLSVSSLSLSVSTLSLYLSLISICLFSLSLTSVSSLSLSVSSLSLSVSTLSLYLSLLSLSLTSVSSLSICLFSLYLFSLCLFSLSLSDLCLFPLSICLYSLSVSTLSLSVSSLSLSDLCLFSLYLSLLSLSLLSLSDLCLFSLSISYVLQVKVEMELEILQCEKIKAVREEQLERLTQICQEQAFEIRQLRAHLAQQDLDLAAEQEAAMQIHHVWGKQRSSYQVVESQGPGESDDEGHGVLRETPADPVVHHDDMNNYISQYYSEQSSDMGGPRVITTAAIDVHLPTTHYPAHNNPLLDVEQMSSAVSDTSTSVSRSSSSLTARPHSLSSHTLRSSTTDCSSNATARDYHTQDQRCFPLPYCSPLGLGLTSAQPPLPRDPSVVVQELLSSLSEDSCLAQKGLVDPVNLKLPSPAGSAKASPELEHRINIYNWKNQEENQYQTTVLLQTKPLIHLHGGTPESSLEEKYRLLGPADGPLGRLPDT
uniref:Uncharacterized protein n=1 Tax=Oncorhynchus kisutch TaxID=8019 RepID=A0A8C7DN29_ONCKI